MALMELCGRCGTKIPYRTKYCDECKIIIDTERSQRDKVRSKKYNSDRYQRDKDNESYRLFYTTQAWKDKRSEIIELYEGHCVICRALYKFVPGRDVHHIEPLLKNFDKRLDNDNLILVCESCHKNIHYHNLDNKDELEKYVNRLIKEDKFIKELLKKK